MKGEKEQIETLQGFVKLAKEKNLLTAEDAAELDAVMEIVKRRYIERLVDQMAMGFILISTAPAKQHAVYGELLKVKEILELHPLFGEYDLIAKIEAEEFNLFGQDVVDKVRSIPGVIDMKTLRPMCDLRDFFDSG